MPIIYGTNFDDILYGTGSADELYAGDGADQVYGGAGNDYIDGGAGADYLAGGAGDDAYIVDDSSDFVYENDGGGYDVVRASVNYQLSDNVEFLVLTGSANLVGRGNAGGNTLRGNAGNNILDGGLGSDMMAGGYGDDTYYVDARFDFVQEFFGQGIDTVVTTTDYYMPANVENLIGDTPYAFLYDQAIRLTLYGNELDNVIIGGGGGGWIYGGGGNDYLTSRSYELDVQLYGGEGNDTFVFNGQGAARGGPGDDIYYANIFNNFVERDGEGTDTVVGGGTLRSNIENVIITSAAGGDGIGNELDNRMTGAAGPDAFSGLAGNDTLAGFAGNDVLDGGAGDDWLVGGAGPDRLMGGAGNDWLVGGAGMDQINGGTGIDRFVFGEGDLGTTQQTADWVQDLNFSEGDRIDLTGIDANVNLAGDQAFAFIGTTGFSGVAGQLRYELLAGERYLQADVNGDGAVDLWLKVDAYAEIASDHFLL